MVWEVRGEGLKVENPGTMSAEALGKRLLGEVREEGLNEVRDINAMKERFMLMYTRLATIFSSPHS